MKRKELGVIYKWLILQNSVQNQSDSRNELVMADIKQISSAPVSGEIVNKKEKTLHELLDAADDFPVRASTGPWYEGYEWCIDNELDDAAAVKKKNYDDSSSLPTKTESEKKVVRPVDKATSKAVKVGTRKAVKAATSTAAKRFAKKADKKGLEDATINNIDSLGNTGADKGVSPKLVHSVSTAVKRPAHSGLIDLSNTAVKKINTGIDSVEPSQKKIKKRNIKKHSLNSPSLRRKLTLDDNDGNRTTSPIFIYIYPQNKPVEC